jgi:Glycosyl hydrolase family 26
MDQHARLGARPLHLASALIALCAACSGATDSGDRAGAAGGGSAGKRAEGGASGHAGAAAVGGGGAAAGAAGRSISGAAGSGGMRAGAAGARPAAAGVGGASAGSAAAGVGGSDSAGGTDILAPEQGALLGHYYGDGTQAQTNMRLGRTPALHLTYYAWEDDWPSDTAKDFAAGMTPLVNWEPDGVDFKQIVSGALDDTIKARATGAKSVGKKFLLDFAAEMNGDEAWGGNDPVLYVNAYRHIHDLFVAAGASNVIWAWCPNVTDVDGGNDKTLDYYPGDAYVDWTGVDGYNWGAGSGFAWQSFHDVFAQIYPLLAAKHKPILIGEMASDENGGDKALWIDAIIPTLRSDFPLIKGVVWFDIHKERHWEINSAAATLAAYARYAQDPFMNP